ncbi:ABC transporter permease [Bacillus sp. B-jedd]|uniref:ABC transporter permease n=1 Tax=Bacillus sp. B-jedd TaxID=1476857 RepID=UPI0005155EAF|nr:ABC transporter permease [Bacillus sp. B-jedd]CEG29087.1 teichoic acid translocation permease; teichoic acid ABC transporter permease [Bacillus sp. B-jedd]
MFTIYREMWMRRKMVHTLALQEIKREYAGTLLGSLWGLVNPLMRIAVFWFVFNIGARAGKPIGNISYFEWLSVGMVGWFLLNDGFRLAKNSFRSKRHIIKNTPFPIAILPAVQILFSFYTHLILLLVIMVVLAISLNGASAYWLQLIYYDFAALMLLMGIGTVTAPLVAVSKDFGRFLDTILIFLFWMTPVFWQISNLGKWAYVVKLNPFHYIVQGYRESLLFHKGFWEHPAYSLYFWVVVFILFIAGNYLYKRLKPIFLDIM